MNQALSDVTKFSITLIPWVQFPFFWVSLKIIKTLILKM